MWPTPTHSPELWVVDRTLGWEHACSDPATVSPQLHWCIRFSLLEVLCPQRNVIFRPFPTSASAFLVGPKMVQMSSDTLREFTEPPGPCCDTSLPDPVSESSSGAAGTMLVVRVLHWQRDQRSSI